MRSAILAALTAALVGMAGMAGTAWAGDDDEVKNDRLGADWNNPGRSGDTLAPWNGPAKKADPEAPWNQPSWTLDNQDDLYKERNDLDDNWRPR